MAGRVISTKFNLKNMSYDENRISDLIDGGLIQQENERRKELLIHFTDVSVCLNNLKELGVKTSPRLKNYIKLMHSSVMIVNQNMPQNIMAEVCFRTANQIIKIVEIETDIRFLRYKLHNYQLS